MKNIYLHELFLAGVVWLLNHSAYSFRQNDAESWALIAPPARSWHDHRRRASRGSSSLQASSVAGAFLVESLMLDWKALFILPYQSLQYFVSLAFLQAQRFCLPLRQCAWSEPSYYQVRWPHLALRGVMWKPMSWDPSLLHQLLEILGSFGWTSTATAQRFRHFWGLTIQGTNKGLSIPPRRPPTQRSTAATELSCFFFFFGGGRVNLKKSYKHMFEFFDLQVLSVIQ